MSGSSRITASYTVPATAGLISFLNVSGGTTSNNTSALWFRDSNGVSFGLDAGTITATVKTDYLTTAALSNHSHGNPTLNLTNLSGTTASNSAGLTLSLSAAATVAQTNQTLGLYGSSQTTGQSSSTTVDARSLTVRGMGIVSVGYSVGELILSASTGGDGFNRIAAGTQTAGTNTTVRFADSNGISFGMSDSSQITASYTVPTVPTAYVSSINGSSGAISLATGSSLSSSTDGSTITFGLASNITTALQSANANYLTSQSNQALSGSNGSFTFQTASFGNSNGLTFYSTNGSMVGSYTVPATAGLISYVNFSGGTTSSNLTQLKFSDSNGVSFGLGANSILTATVKTDYLTTAALSNHSHGNPQLNLTNLAGTTASNSAGFTLSLSHNISTAALSNHSHGDPTLALTNLSGTTASNSAGLTLSLSAAAPGAGGGFAAQGSGTYTQNTGTIQFANSNGITFGLSTNQMTASHNGLTTAAASDHSHGNPTLALTNLSGTTASASNGLTLSLSAAAPGGGAGVTLSGLDPFHANERLAIAGGQASLWVVPLFLQAALQFDRFGLRITGSNATNSSGSATISVWVGISTRNGSSLSSVGSTSFTTAITQSGTAGSYSHYGGVKILPVPWTTTLSPGNYWVGIVSRTTTGGANMTFGNLGVSQIASTWSGFFGSASAATAGIYPGHGVYSATTAGMPTAISMTQINGNSSAFVRFPTFLFLSDIF
jgi:hypothetical protein